MGGRLPGHRLTAQWPPDVETRPAFREDEECREVPPVESVAEDEPEEVDG